MAHAPATPDVDTFHLYVRALRFTPSCILPVRLSTLSLFLADSTAAPGFSGPGDAVPSLLPPLVCPSAAPSIGP